MKINRPWIDTEKELPEKDGMVEVTNHPDKEDCSYKEGFTALATYDGWGFEVHGIYREPRYWRPYRKDFERKYGKEASNDSND